MRPSIKNPQDLAGGLLLIAIGLAGRLLLGNVSMGTAARMGPAYMPALVSWAILAIGVVLCARALALPGPRLERWHARPLAVVLGSMVLFGLLIEGSGLVAACLALILLAGLAERGRRWPETIAFALALTAFAVVVFKLLLGLPMSVWPRWI